jgi:transposase
VAKDSRGYDAGKKIEGRKRHLAVDVLGLILCVVVTAASVQDRDGVRPLLWKLAAGYRAGAAATSSTASATWFITAACGGRCLRTCRTGAPFTVTSGTGTAAARRGGCMTRCVRVTWMKTTLRRTLQVVRRPDDLHTFQVLPRRWVVERTFGWIMKHRRCARDYERLPDHHETYLYWSMIHVMAARVARRPSPAPSAPVPALPQAAPARTVPQAALQMTSRIKVS